jgi:CheY-like chemotaxis protein
MEAIGNLAGGIAHDFNNTLGIIVGNIDLLLTQLRPGSEEAAMIESALQAAQRGADLTGALLAFARRQPLSPRVTDVNALIRGMSPMLHRSLGEQISIRIVTAEDLWPVQVDPGQLQAALLNLAINARDAMPEGGTLTIETVNARLDGEGVAAAFEGGPGDYVLLIVADTGIGMSAEILAHMFEPFFTTKDPGKGTGLGLSMVFGFVKQSGGHIKAYSEPGFGSTMKLYLPRAPVGEGAVEADPADVPALAKGGETILAVEDNPGMRQTVVAQLRGLGYAVAEADSPRAALEVIESGVRIDLLFTDIVMPGGMSGIDLTREARHRRPGLKVVATSGFHMGALENGKRLPADVPLLTKPYRLVDLSRILRTTLDAPSGAGVGGR